MIGYPHKAIEGVPWPCPCETLNYNIKIRGHSYLCRNVTHSTLWITSSRTKKTIRATELSSISTPSLIRIFRHLEQRLLWFEEFGSRKPQKISMRRHQLGGAINEINKELGAR